MSRYDDYFEASSLWHFLKHLNPAPSVSFHRPKTRHRKLWKDEGRWEHDKFREDEQAPKSREELIAMYGYDIRNANGPSDGRLYRARKPRYSSNTVLVRGFWGETAHDDFKNIFSLLKHPIKCLFQSYV